MRPILLHGHDRSLTKIKYNKEGDLLFSVSKDAVPTVWYSHNGERLGTYKGHNGAVWCIDVDWQSKYVLTASADSSAKLWDCKTGKNLFTFSTNSAARTCGFSYSGKLLFYSTDERMNFPCEIYIHDVADDISKQSAKPKMVIPIEAGNKVTSCLFMPLDSGLISGHEDGTIIIWDFETGKKKHTIKEHKGAIVDIQFSPDELFFITASKDFVAKVFNAQTLDVYKVFSTERPVNAAAISPIRPHVILGGGQEAMSVTTTSTRVGKFETRFFHLVFEEEIGRVKGHFGPINTVAFHPNGKSYASGGEDGYIRVHFFDDDYFDFEFEY